MKVLAVTSNSPNPHECPWFLFDRPDHTNNILLLLLLLFLLLLR